MPLAKKLAYALFFSALAGCKLNVVVPDGGEVRSASDSYICTENESCVIDVEDGAAFVESFYPLSRPDYAFVGWKQEAAHLCGGSSRSCAVTAPGAFTALDVEFFISPVFEAIGDSVINAQVLPSGEYLTLHKVNRWSETATVINEFTGSSVDLSASTARTYIGYMHGDQQAIVAASLYPNGDLRAEVYRGASESKRVPAGSGDSYASLDGNIRIVEAIPPREIEQDFSALGAFTEGASVPVREFPTSVVVDMESMAVSGITDPEEVIEKIETSFNINDALYIRDTGFSHPIDRVLLTSSGASENSNWTRAWEVILDRFGTHDSTLFATVGGGFGAGFGALCGITSINGIGPVGNRVPPGEFWLVMRHELGHNHGLGHDAAYGVGEDYQRAQPLPQGNTIMSGNAQNANQINGRQFSAMTECIGRRDQQLELLPGEIKTPTSSLAPVAYPVPPGVVMDEVFNSANAGAVRIDVLSNDFDVNRELIAIADFTRSTALGGQVRLVASSGGTGRDLLEYQYPADGWSDGDYDEVDYFVIDESGQVSQGKAVIHLNGDRFISRLPAIQIDALLNDPEAFAEFLQSYEEVVLTLDYANTPDILSLPVPGEDQRFAVLEIQTGDRVTVLELGASTIPLSANDTLTVDPNNGTASSSNRVGRRIDAVWPAFNQQQLDQVFDSASSIQTLYGLYEVVTVQTIDGFWRQVFDLPASVFEGSRFQLEVSSTFPVVVNASGASYELNTGESIDLMFSGGAWMLTDVGASSNSVLRSSRSLPQSNSRELFRFDPSHRHTSQDCGHKHFPAP